MNKRDKKIKAAMLRLSRELTGDERKSQTKLTKGVKALCNACGVEFDPVEHKHVCEGKEDSAPEACYLYSANIYYDSCI